jgi:hypothetical protein
MSISVRPADLRKQSRTLRKAQCDYDGYDAAYNPNDKREWPEKTSAERRSHIDVHPYDRTDNKIRDIEKRELGLELSNSH